MDHRLHRGAYLHHRAGVFVGRGRRRLPGRRRFHHVRPVHPVQLLCAAHHRVRLLHVRYQEGLRPHARCRGRGAEAGRPAASHSVEGQRSRVDVDGGHFRSERGRRAAGEAGYHCSRGGRAGRGCEGGRRRVQGHGHLGQGTRVRPDHSHHRAHHLLDSGHAVRGRLLPGRRLRHGCGREPGVRPVHRRVRGAGGDGGHGSCRAS